MKGNGTIGVLDSEKKLICSPLSNGNCYNFRKYAQPVPRAKNRDETLERIIRRRSTEIKRRNARENKEIDRNGMQVKELKRESGSDKIVRTRMLL